MKIIFLLITFLSTFLINAQIVNIPDANFKNALLAHSPVIDVNNDNEIQISEALNTTYMRVWYSSISSLQGIEAFANLTTLNCYNNQLSSLDLSQNINLTQLLCSNNQLTSLNVTLNIDLTLLTCINNQLTTLDVTQNINLETLGCSNNQITALDVTQNTNLNGLYFNNNQISTIDLTNHINLTELWCYDNLLDTLDVSNSADLYVLQCKNNPNLTYINLNNGNNDAFIYFDNINYSSSHFENLPNLQTVCVDELNTNLTTNILNHVGHSVVFTTGCNTASIEDDSLLALTIYPIPTKDVLHIISNKIISKIEIYNHLGQLVSSNNDKTSINISTLIKSVYFCKITDEIGNVAVKRIIKIK